MTIMIHSDYERGWDAAQRALDQSTLSAEEMRRQMRPGNLMNR